MSFKSIWFLIFIKLEILLVLSNNSDYYYHLLAYNYNEFFYLTKKIMKIYESKALYLTNVYGGGYNSGRIENVYKMFSYLFNKKIKRRKRKYEEN